MSNCYKYSNREDKRVITKALAHQIIIAPIVTEKALAIGEKGYVSFVVRSGFSKGQIGKAFSLIYEGLIDNVLKVNVINQKGKTKRNAKRMEYKRPGFKKAMILVRVNANSQELMNSVYGGDK